MPAWWDRFFALEQSYSYSSLSISIRKAGLNDADVPSLALALRDFISCNVDPKLPLHIELDASENNLEDQSMAMLLQVLLEHPGAIYLRNLKIYKNRVSDLTCVALAKILWHQSEACEELHLSHNEIRHRGVCTLLAVLAMHPKEVYPRQVEHLDEAIPCWLRLEHNQATSVEHLLSALQKDPVRLRYCMAPRSETASCSAFRCAAASERKDETPHVHLYCINKQKDKPLLEELQLETMVLAVADTVAAGQFGLENSEVDQRPSGKLPATPPPAAITSRSVTLRVDPETGAGLEMTAHSYGYHVDQVEDQPGQDLQPGDVLLSVDGEALWGDLSEDELTEAFGREFADGATVLVARAEEVQGCHVWQPLGLELSCRAVPLLAALREDLGIMGNNFGVSVELEEGAVWLRGPASCQRAALVELPNLLRFYFPELRGSSWPTCSWVKEEEKTQSNSKNGSVCAERTERVDPVEAYQDLTQWESALRKQCKEDDDIFDDDLPVEPLEAPDEGPEVFEGETMLPELDMSLPFKMLILVGLPGSGKSSLAARLAGKGYDVVNQDNLGDRKSCVQAVKDALAESRRLVVDRCNCTRLQRRVWLELAKDYEVGAACIWLDIPEATCGDRVLQRFGHRTLPPEDKSLEVISGFAQRFEPPMEAEGFVRWRVKDDGDLEEALLEFLELVKDSEAGRLGEPETLETVSTSDLAESSPDPPKKRRRLDAEAAAAGRPKALELHGRATRTQFLRVLRRQVEYYFSDKNLKRDWFFQEKIAGEPESGWLELRWIMSCPRVADVHRASEKDVLEALKFSTLKVKEVDGCHWVARPQPLPALEVKRPEVLHESVDGEEDAMAATIELCEEDYSDTMTKGGESVLEEDKGIRAEENPEEADLSVQRLRQDDGESEGSQEEEEEEVLADPYM